MKLDPLLGITFTLFWLFSAQDQLSYYENSISYWENTVPYVKTQQAYTQLGYAYFDGRQYEKAVMTLQPVQPDPFDARYSRYYRRVGKSGIELGDYTCGMRALETAIEFGAADASVALDLARNCLAVGDRTRAKKYFDYVRRVSKCDRMRR